MFSDRREAGQQLAARLEHYRPERPVVLGIPRGGLPVAAEIAAALHAPLDILVVRKLGVPWHREFAFGAIGPNGVTLLDDQIVAELNIDQKAIDRVIRQETAELERRCSTYRGGQTPVSYEGRPVILVDDGIATGNTIEVAAHIVRAHHASSVVIAAPVAPPDAVTRLRHFADDVVVCEQPENFRAVGQFYREFHQVPDSDVANILRQSGNRDV